MIAKCRSLITPDFELMYSSRVGVIHFVSSRTPERNEFVTSFVNNERTYLALISLFTKTPHKFSAMTA